MALYDLQYDRGDWGVYALRAKSKKDWSAEDAQDLEDLATPLSIDLVLDEEELWDLVKILIAYLKEVGKH